ASGQMYRRNRYYDPATGQFTQPDPIGLAGGLNAYGFAAGDPVSYSDPYGLASDTIVPVGNEAKSVLFGLFMVAQFASESDDPRVAAAGSALLSGLVELHAHPKKVFFTIDPSVRSTTGPLLDGSGNYRANVNPNQSTKRHIGVRAAHELGHAYGVLINRATDPNNSADRRMQNRNSLYFENSVRTIFGCVPRLIHGTDSNAQNPGCQP
ncbi:MAG TPA: RHS repeat-associated core domain-containing protein, partial [Longimicrobium sp.]